MSDGVDGPETRADAASGEPGSQRQADPGADHQQVEAPPSAESGSYSQRKYIPLFFRRYRTALILLGLAIVLIASAFHLYPRRPAIYRPTPLAVRIRVLNGVPESAFIQVIPVRSGLFTLSIGLNLNAQPDGRPVSTPITTRTPPPPPPPPAPPPPPTYASLARDSKPSLVQPFFAHLLIDLPAGATVQGCHNSRIPASPTTASGCFFSSSLSLLSETLDDFPLDAANESGVEYENRNLWYLSFDFTIKAPELAWDSNGVNLEAQLPVVTMAQFNSNFVHPIPVAGNTNISIAYDIPNVTGYDWSGGPAPYSTSTIVTAGYLGGIWYERVDGLTEPVPLSATNNSAANTDSIHTFIAGALVGLGGGAVVGAIQEGLKRPENESSPPDGSEEDQK